MIRFRRFLIFILLVTLTFAFENILFQESGFSATLVTPGNVQVTPSVDANYLNANLNIKWDVVPGATAYSIKVTQVGTTDFLLNTVSGENNNQIVISNLTGGVTYSVQVRTIKLLEYSDWSSDKLLIRPTTLPNSPSKPLAIPSLGGATVSWSALTSSELGGGDLVSYVVREVVSNNTVTATPTETSVIFTGLTNGTKASFTVTAITTVNKNGSTSLSSDEIQIGNVVSPGVSPTPTPSVSIVASPSPSTTQGPVVSTGGGGGISSAKQTAAYFLIVNPQSETEIYSKIACVDVYSTDLVPQFKGQGCSTQGGLINLLLTDGGVTIRVYENGYGQNYRLYHGKVENDQLLMDDAKFFVGTTRYALTVPTNIILPTNIASPSSSPRISESPKPLISPSPSSTPVDSPRPTFSPTPKPRPTYIIYCIKGSLKKSFIGLSPTCPKGFKVIKKTLYQIPVAKVSSSPTRKITPAPKRTLICFQGKKSTRVISSNPVCPKGYSLKK